MKDPELKAFDLDAPPDPAIGVLRDQSNRHRHQDPFRGLRCEECGAPRTEGCAEDCTLYRAPERPPERPGVGEYYSVYDGPLNTTVPGVDRQAEARPTTLLQALHYDLQEAESRIRCLEHDLCDMRNMLRALYTAAYDNETMHTPDTEHRLNLAISAAHKFLFSDLLREAKTRIPEP